MDTQFRTIVLFGRDGRYGAQLANLDTPIWGDTPQELGMNLATAISRLSSAQTKEIFGPLGIEAKAKRAG